MAQKDQQAVRDFYENDQLIALTKELTETLRKNRTIDWSRRESARANMRRLVKRLLKKYNYPPEEAQNALDTVLRQCEQWVDYDHYRNTGDPDVFDEEDIDDIVDKLNDWD